VQLVSQANKLEKAVVAFQQEVVPSGDQLLKEASRKAHQGLLIKT